LSDHPLEAPLAGPSSFDQTVHTPQPYTPGERQAKAEIPGTGLYAGIKPSAQQVGGMHYKMLRIQPMEYALANGLNYAQANAIKYITRYNLKDDGKNWRQDLEKAIHGLQMLIEWEEKERNG
jgi:hypothetical protein